MNEKRASHRIARSLIAYGVLETYSKKKGICNPSDMFITTSPFFWRNKALITKYIDGCFYPYLLELDKDKVHCRTDKSGKNRYYIYAFGSERHISEQIDKRANKRVHNSKEVTKRVNWL